MTCPQWPGRRVFRVLTAPLAVAGLLTGLAPAAASAAACQGVTGGPGWTAGQQPPSPGTTANVLNGVAVLSACNAWAVGFAFGNGAQTTLIEHWDGSSWTQVASPSPGTIFSSLDSVRGVSPASIWAVGSYSSGAGNKALIEHWDGTAWTQVTSSNPGTADELHGVRAVSAANIWAVGTRFNGMVAKTLILHWNGTAWKQVPSPSPGSSSTLFSVAATSASSAWAVGNAGRQTLVLHWNGTRWKRVASPSPGPGNELLGVGATAAASVWAVGFSSSGDPETGTVRQTLILHWNGTRWTQVASPDQGGSATSNFLKGVTVTSARNAWAVGGVDNGSGDQTVVLHWNGTRWTHVPSPNPGSGNDLFGVAATSASSAWAVGSFFPAGGVADQALAEHCC